MPCRRQTARRSHHAAALAAATSDAVHRRCPGGHVRRRRSPRRGPAGRELADALVDAIDDLVRRRRAGRDADRVRGEEPFRAQIRLRLDVVDARRNGSRHVFTSSRVLLLLAPPMTMTTSERRASSTRGVLALLGRLADGVDEADVGLREIAVG